MHLNWRFTRIILLVSLAYAGIGCNNKQAVGVVDLTYLFENFDYTIESKQEFERIKQSRQLVIDSLRLDAEVLMTKARETNDPDLLELFEVKRDNYLRLKENHDQSLVRLTEEYDERILTQLSSYVEDFGKDNGYDIILGQNAQGNIMYAAEPVDLSEQVLEYINMKYQGDEEN